MPLLFIGRSYVSEDGSGEHSLDKVMTVVTLASKRFKVGINDIRDGYGWWQGIKENNVVVNVDVLSYEMVEYLKRELKQQSILVVHAGKERGPLLKIYTDPDSRVERFFEGGSYFANMYYIIASHEAIDEFLTKYHTFKDISVVQITSYEFI